jgi:hypothetical protein
VKTVGDFKLAVGPIEKAAGKEKGELLYNEFVVYDKAKVKVRYLCEVEFDSVTEFF